MFKITGRIILILLAASLVAGILYLLVNGAGGQPGLLSSLDHHAGFDGSFRIANGQANLASFLAQGFSNLGQRPNFGDGGFRNRFSFGRSFSGVISDLIVITLITVVVVLIHGAAKKAVRRPPEKSV